MRSTAKIRTVICERLIAGESLRAICAAEGMPSRSTVFRWLDADEDFRDQYARARELQADALFEEILEIADDGRNDWMERLGEDGSKGWLINGEHVQRSRLRVDARKWAASKLAPKKYGEATLLKHADADGQVIKELSDTEIAARLAAMGAVLNRKLRGSDVEDEV